MFKTAGKITLETTFPVRLADYQIAIPKVVFYNIAETVQVQLTFQYEPYAQ